MVCGGLWWFACIVSGYTKPIVPNCGGDLWWFAVMCGGLRWFAMVCGGLSFSHDSYPSISPPPWPSG